MWGGLFGFALYRVGWLVGGWVFLGAMLPVYLLFRTKLSALSTPLWIGAWGLLFGMYCEVRTPAIERAEVAFTLYDSDIFIDYPIVYREGQAQTLRAEVAAEGTHERLTILLHTSREACLPDSLLYGAHLVGTLDVNPLHLLSSHEYAAQLRAQGIEAVGYLQHYSAPSDALSLSLTARLRLWREHLMRTFDDSAEGAISAKGRVLLYALVLGERSGLDKTDREIFSEAGLSHLLALSGFHLGIIYLVISRVLKRLLPTHRHRRLRYILLLLSLVGYTLFTGAAPSTLRALLMSGLYIVSRLLGLRPDGVQTLSLTLLILWLVRPWSIQSPGLIMSASAVWGILAFFPLLDSLLSTRHPWVKYLYEAFCLMLSAQIGILPWLFFFWGSGSLMPFWSSLPMTLLSVLLIPLGLVSIVSGMIFPSSWMAVLLQPLGFLVDLLYDGSVFFAHIPLPTLSVSLGLPSVALYYILCHYLVYRPLAKGFLQRQRKNYAFF